MAENVYNWQFNTLPGNANQGAILMTKNNITQPPFTQDDFVWKAMEDIIGTADVKLEYDKDLNRYKLYKARGHRDNDGTWIYDWTYVGGWEPLTAEVADILRSMTYVEYIFTATDETLKIEGKQKDGTITTLCDVTFATKQYVDDAIRGLKGIIPGDAIGIEDVTVEGQQKSQISVKFDANDFALNSNNQLKSLLIDDTLTSSTTKTYSIDKILDLIKHKWTYKGEVADKTVLPSVSKQGDVYGVVNEADLYVNISSTNTPNWYPFTCVAESFTAYGVELHKGTNGMYAKLRYDDVDFTIDNLQNLKSQLIDDTIDASSPLANRKTYSVDKILQLLSSMFVYKGQVNYYDLLPTTGNKVGDTYNVVYVGTSTQGSTELDGDNYAWNGTGWDDLSGEYRAGAGIVINGKVISATGISFIVGDGLQATGAGSTQTLSTRITNGLERVNVGTAANPVYADGVKKGSGITVNTNGVNVNTGYTTKLVNDNLEVDYANGLEQDTNNKLAVKQADGILVNTNGVGINTNFNIKSTPLGTNNSKLSLYTDGKVGVDTDSVVLTAQLLSSFDVTNNNWRAANIIISNFSDYDMFQLSFDVTVGGTFFGEMPVGMFFKPTQNGNLSLYSLMSTSGNVENPAGLRAYKYTIANLNVTTGAADWVGGFYADSFLSTSQSWTKYQVPSGQVNRIKIYGVKAR